MVPTATDKSEINQHHISNRSLDQVKLSKIVRFGPAQGFSVGNKELPLILKKVQNLPQFVLVQKNHTRRQLISSSHSLLKRLISWLIPRTTVRNKAALSPCIWFCMYLSDMYNSWHPDKFLGPLDAASFWHLVWLFLHLEDASEHPGLALLGMSISVPLPCRY